MLAELSAGFAVIGDAQFLPGYCVLLSKNPLASALAELPRDERVQFLADVDLLATAVERACRAMHPGFRRINIDVLGNKDAFVHAHVWARYEWEPPEQVARPVWLYPPDQWRDPTTVLSSQHDCLRDRIQAELDALIGGAPIEVKPAGRASCQR